MDSCGSNSSCGGIVNSCGVDVFSTTGVFGEESQEVPEVTETPTIESRDISLDCKFSMSVVLQLPKFSKGYKPEFFDDFITSNVGEDFVALGRLSFPNEWQIVVKTSNVREKLLRMRRTKVNGRTCWIKPLSNAEIRGNLHWLPMEIPDSALIPVLQEYGEVLFLECETERTGISDMRRFSIFLKKGMTKHHIPHYLKVGNCRVLITIQGREPMCFHCKDIGHRKVDCIKHQLRMHDMGNNAAGGEGKIKKRSKPRGKRCKEVTVKDATENKPEEVEGATTAAVPKRSVSAGKKAKSSVSVTKTIAINTTIANVNVPLAQGSNTEVSNVDSEPAKQAGVPSTTGEGLDSVTKLLDNLSASLNVHPQTEVHSASAVPTVAASKDDTPIHKNLAVSGNAKVCSAEPQQGAVQAIGNEGAAPKTSKNKKKKKKKH